MSDARSDNLRTNHRGTWVLQDAQHKPIVRLSSLGDDSAARKHAMRVSEMNFLRFSLTQMLYQPCGVIRGAAAALGLAATVQPELSGSQVTFQVRTAGK